MTLTLSRNVFNEGLWLLASISAQVKSRVGNPFLGAFTLSWLTINHRYIVDLLASDESLSSKSKYLSSTYFSSYNDPYFLWNCLVFPLAAAVFIIFFYPIVNAKLLEWSNYGKNYLKKKSAEIDGVQVFTDGQLQIANEEIARVRRDLRIEVAKFKDIEDRNSNLESDKTLLESNKAELEKQKTQLEREKTVLEKEKTDLVTYKVNAENELTSLNANIESYHKDLERMRSSLEDSDKKYFQFVSRMSEELGQLDNMSRDVGVSKSTKHAEQLVAKITDLLSEIAYLDEENKTKEAFNALIGSSEIKR